MTKNKLSPIFYIFLVIGVVSACVLLFFRVRAELKSDKLTFAIPDFSIQTLAKEDGRTEGEWLSDMYDAGIRHFIITKKDPDNLEALAREKGFEIARTGGKIKQGDSFSSPKLSSDSVSPNHQYTGDKSVPVAVVENPFRTFVLMPDNFDPDSFEYPMIKTMFMYNSYSYHYEYNEPSTENENILFRGIVERGMRLIIFTHLVDEQKNIVTDPAAYKDIIDGLDSRLETYGISIGTEFSTLDAPKFNPTLFALALLLLVCAVIYFIAFFVELPFKYELMLEIAGACVAFGGAFVVPGIMQKFAPFGAALVFGLFEVLLLHSVATSKLKVFEHKCLALRFVVALLLAVAIGLSGGLFVSALLGTRLYMLGFNIFSGVKVAQLAPVGFAALFFAYIFYNKKARAQNKNSNKLPLPFIIICSVLVLAALVIFVLRSGDNMLPVSDLEITFRNWLEYVLYARPRTKEMFIAFPAIALFVVAAHKRYPILELPLAVLACLGTTSVINTFCHIFTPVHVSVIRTLLGMAIGAVLGVMLMYIFLLFLGKQKEK